MTTPERVLRDFLENYPDEAINSIVKLANDRSLTWHKFKGIELTESVQKYTDFIKGYAEYRIDEIKDPKMDKIINEAVREKGNVILSDLFPENAVRYPEASQLVENTLQHISELPDLITSLQSGMMEAGVDQESVGMISELANQYSAYFQERVDSVMDTLLWASGYHASKILAPTANVKKPAPSYFL